MDSARTLVLKVLNYCLTIIFSLISILSVLGVTVVVVGIGERVTGNIGYNGTRLEDFLKFTILNFVLLLFIWQIKRKLKRPK